MGIWASLPRPLSKLLESEFAGSGLPLLLTSSTAVGLELEAAAAAVRAFSLRLSALRVPPELPPEKLLPEKTPPPTPPPPEL